MIVISRTYFFRRICLFLVIWIGISHIFLQKRCASTTGDQTLVVPGLRINFIYLYKCMFLGQNFDLEAFYTIIFNPFQDVLLQDFFTNRQVSDEYLTHYMRFTLHQLFVSPTQIFLYLYFRKYNIWQQTYLVISTAVIM